jgi:multiple sugar transport system permease protein
MIAPLVVGIVARWILAPSDGVLAHLVGHRIDVLSDAGSAPLAVAGAMAWQDTGFAAIVLAGALSSVPRDLTSAAMIDGASPWRILRSVEIPLLVPTLLFLAVTGSVRAASLYDLTVPLTGGGPAGATTTVSGLAVSTAWDQFDFGDAAVISLLTGAAVLIVVAPLFRLARRASS